MLVKAMKNINLFLCLSIYSFVFVKTLVRYYKRILSQTIN